MDAALRTQLTATIGALRGAADPRAAAAMSAYMRDLFPFLGLSRPARRPIERPFLGATRTASAADLLEILDATFAEPEREIHYLGIAVIDRRWRTLDAGSVGALVPYVDRHAWWDSVDALRKPVGLWTKAHRGHHRALHERLLAGSMWQRRVAITLQLQWKADTDVELLADAVVRNVEDREFFVQKAIGWALRDYSKTDPRWVRALLDEAAITGLARREASKYL